MINTSNKRVYLLLWVMCLIGAAAILPYTYYLGLIHDSLEKVALIVMLQSVLLYALVVWLCYKIIPRTDLHPFETTDPLRRIVYPGLIAGVVLGLVLFAANKLLFTDSFANVKLPPVWARGIASLYGGINEEVILRLFLFSTVYFLLALFLKWKRMTLLWIANFIVAIAFGAAHLPLAYKLTEPTSSEIARILLLNGIAGLTFGSLYISRGIWTVIFAHFIADLMIHLIFI